MRGLCGDFVTEGGRVLRRPWYTIQQKLPVTVEHRQGSSLGDDDQCQRS